MPRTSAGLLLYRRSPDGGIEVLLGHMGGPFWARRDEGAWSIPKGEHGPDADPLTEARREFEEEIGRPPPDGPALALGEIRQAGGKVVAAWAVEGDMDVAKIQSNAFTVEWPRGSGRLRSFPELDRAEWLPLDVARTKIVRGQAPLLDALASSLAG
jgi:predicted NUDIX family NTP pyrophosphohydrolase